MIIDSETGEIVTREEALPALGEFSPVGWTAPASMTYEEWEQAGRTLQQIQGAVNWWVGDWLNEGEKRYGETYAQAIEATGWKYDMLRKCKWVSGRVQMCNRLHNLSWTHHHEVAALPPDEQAELLAWAEANEASVAELKIEKRRRPRAAALEERGRSGSDMSSSVLCGDMRDLSANIPENSIDMIFTDPPYAEEHLPLFEALSAVAARVLKPGGICMAYSGQIFLPEVMDRLGRNLEYLWTCAIRHSGGNQRIFKVNVNTSWKPVLWYIKPPREVFWDSFIDMVSGGMEKDLHGWQQSEAEAAYFIDRLCPPGGVVLDPFCGSGTTLAAALHLGRIFLGFDIDPDSVNLTRSRLDDQAEK